MFDPYHKWLGIAPTDQPPNHYRLLGVDLFESDPDVIDTAANKQMVHLQSCATGPHVALSQKLLNEIAVARLCLLDSKEKAAYDATLKAKQTPSKPPPKQTALSTRTALSTSESKFAKESEPTGRQKPKAKVASSNRKVFIGIGGSVATAVIIGGILLFANSGKERKNQESGETEEVVAKASPSPSPKKGPNLLPKPESKPETKSELKPEVKPPKEVVSSEPPAPKTEKYLTNSIGMKLVRIEPGKFLIGSPFDEIGRFPGENQYLVEIKQPFFLGIHEVTQKQWQAVMGNNPSLFKGDDLPVERVSWHDCQEFCKKLSQEEGRKYRLPTEAEWEYSCRAGTTTAYSFGDNPGQLGGYAWYGDNSGNQTHPVGQKKPNGWGLFDMHGSVFEWCVDSEEDSKRIRRGGCFANGSRFCRSAYRYPVLASYLDFDTGFRVALILSEPGLLAKGEPKLKPETKPEDFSPRWIALADTAEQVKVHWKPGDNRGSFFYDADKKALEIKSPWNLGSFVHNGRWREFQFEIFVKNLSSGRFDVQINGSNLDLGKAVAGAKDGVVVSIQYNPSASTVVAFVKNEIVSRATILDCDWGNKFNCKLSSNGGGTAEISLRNIRLNENLSPATKPGVYPEKEKEKPAPVVTENKKEKEQEKPTALIPIPEAEAQKKAEAIIKDVFKKEYAKAKQPADKASLAEKMFKQGVETKDDPVARFILLREARDLAAGAGAVLTTMKAIEELAKTYEVKPLEMKLEALTQASKLGPLSKQKEVVESALDLIEEAIAEDNYEVALKLGAVALTSAKSDTPLTRKTTTWLKDIQEMHKVFESIKNFMEVLEKKPDEPEANTAVGKYLCMLKGDWTQGLPMLAKGKDGILKGLAQKDQAQPSEEANQVAVGDGWWEMAQKEDGLAKAHMLLRSKYWYCHFYLVTFALSVGCHNGGKIGVFSEPSIKPWTNDP